jgi:anti-anti-sigma factor
MPGLGEASMGGASCASDMDGDDLVVTIVGDLDMAAADEVLSVAKRALKAAVGATRLVVDVAGTTFADSMGLATLLQMRYAANNRGLPMRLRNLTQQLTRALEVSGLASVFGTTT